MQFRWSARQAFCNDRRVPGQTRFFCCFFIRFRCRKTLRIAKQPPDAFAIPFHGAKLQQRLISMPLLIPLCLGAARPFNTPFQSSFMNIFNLFAIKRRRKWISILASWRKLTYDGEKKDKRLHLENQVDCCVLSSRLSLSSKTLFPSQSASSLFACSRRWKIQFGCLERNFPIFL